MLLADPDFRRKMDDVAGKNLIFLGGYLMGYNFAGFLHLLKIDSNRLKDTERYGLRHVKLVVIAIPPLSYPGTEL